ncbi:MAG: arginine--tRNA ligase [Myxococcales bacterium]|nr:arginine--tRNA ligase [Myxococcales bacterium]
MSTLPPVYARLTDHVVAAVRAAFPDLDALPDVQVVRSKPDFPSDYQTAVAMQLAKPLRRAPRQIAEGIAEALRARAADLVATVEITGPGFLALTLSDAGLADVLAEQVASPRLGAPTLEGTVVIDFSSPNVAKQMHVGHLRSTIIGDALRRIGSFLGHTVVGDNHIGDWGTQFGQLIYAWNHWRDDDAYAADPVAELERLYVKFHQASALDDALNDAARAELAKLQAGDPTNRALWAKFRDDSQHAFDTVYDRLGVRFDETLGESFYHEMLAPLVDDLVARGLAERSEGAMCVFFRDAAGEDTLPPFLVQKKDGAFLYATTDLATIRYRKERWDPVRVVYVTDLRQRLHFQQLFATAAKMGIDTRLDHVWFGLMKLPEGSFSTRKGNVIALKTLLDEGEARARAVLEARNAEQDDALSDAEMDALAPMIGLGAIKYADLSNHPQTDVVFEFDKMLALNGDTAVYLQYTSARTHAVQRKADAAGAPTPADHPVHLEAPEERDLLLHLLDFGAAVHGAWENGRPSDVAHYLYQLATRYHRFYAKCPILKAEGALQASRLSLNALTQRTLTTGLDLLGIDAPTRM